MSERRDIFFFFFSFDPVRGRIEKRVLRQAGIADGYMRRCVRAKRSAWRTLAIHEPVHLTRLSPSESNAKQRARDSQLESAFARLHGCRHLGSRPVARPPPCPAPRPTERRGATRIQKHTRPSELRAAAAARRYLAADGWVRACAGTRCCRIIAAANKGRFVGRAGRKIVAFSQPVAARPRPMGGSARFVFFRRRKVAACREKSRKSGSITGNPTSIDISAIECSRDYPYDF